MGGIYKTDITVMLLWQISSFTDKGSGGLVNSEVTIVIVKPTSSEVVVHAHLDVC